MVIVIVDINRLTLSAILGLFISTQPITGCPKYINEKGELVIVHQLDTFKKEGKQYYIGEEKVVKTNASFEDFMRYRCEPNQTR